MHTSQYCLVHTTTRVLVGYESLDTYLWAMDTCGGGGGMLGPKMRGKKLAVRSQGTYYSSIVGIPTQETKDRKIFVPSVCLYIYSLFSYLEGGLLYYWL